MHVAHASAVKKRDHQKFVGGFALSGFLGCIPIHAQAVDLNLKS